MTEMTDERSASPEVYEVYTVREIAARLNVATGTVNTWIRQGRLTPLRRSTAGYLVPAAEVERIERERQRNTL